LIVVDASVLANVVGDDGDDGAAARGRMRSEAALAAPDLIDIETLAVLRKRWLAGSLTETRFQDAINDLRALALDRYPALPLIGRIAELRANVTAYDAAYVALAEALGCRYSPPTSASPTPPARSAPSWSSCRSSGKNPSAPSVRNKWSQTRKPAIAVLSRKRTTGVEPATFGLGSRRSTN
jgi:predicted nucleic acid-binding protein